MTTALLKATASANWRKESLMEAKFKKNNLGQDFCLFVFCLCEGKLFTWNVNFATMWEIIIKMPMETK